MKKNTSSFEREKTERPNLDKWLKRDFMRKWHLNWDLQDKEFTGRERGWNDFQAEARGFVISFYSTYDLLKCLYN